VAGLVLTEHHEVTRRARHSELGSVTSALSGAPGPVFAVDSPDLVFGYYLNRAVVPLTYYSQFARLAGPAWLIASERAVNSPTASARRVATARVNGRAFTLLGK